MKGMDTNPYESPREVDIKPQTVWRPTAIELMVLWAAAATALSICLPNPHLVPRWFGVASLMAFTGLTVLNIGIGVACVILRVAALFENRTPPN
jgi:hypothetical protein